MRFLGVSVWLVLVVLGMGGEKAVAASNGDDAYWSNDYGSQQDRGRYLPRRPGEETRRQSVVGSPAKVDLPAGRYEPRRPGAERLTYFDGEENEAVLQPAAGSVMRFEPRRPDEDERLSRRERRKQRKEKLETGYDWYVKVDKDGVPMEVQEAMPYVRDFEGTVKGKVKKAVWKKVVVAPVKVAVKSVYKTGKKVVWKGLVSSWLPVM